MEEEVAAPEDLTSWWPGGENGSPPGPLANPWQSPRRVASELPAQAPPELGIGAHRTPDQSEPQDWPAVRSEIRSLVRMSEAVLDTLASQLRQDEQATRQVTEHLGEVDTQLERLSQRLETSVADGKERGSALAVFEGYTDAVGRLESGMQTLRHELERMQRMQQMSQRGLTGRAIFVGGAYNTSHRLHLDPSRQATALTLGAGTALFAGLGMAVRRLRNRLSA